MKIRRMLKEVPRWVKYALIFSVCMLILSLLYPYISEWAMSRRASTAPGGEILLWLIPFMVCVGVSTAREWFRHEK